VKKSRSISWWFDLNQKENCHNTSIKMERDAMNFVGVDPGASGGLAFMNDKDIVLLKMPDTEWDIYQAINLNVGKNAFAIVEHVQGYVGSPTTGSQMFNFGWNYGSLRMALFSNHVPFEKVSPGKWQQSFGIAKRGPNETRSKFKNRLKAKAQELFPSVKGITLKTCDALLLVEYARRMKKT